GHDTDVFGVAAARRLKACGNAGALVLRTLRINAMTAGVAIETGNVVMEADALPDLKTTHFGPEANDGPGSLVTKDPGWRYGAIVDFFYVGRTNATSCDTDKKLIRADSWNGQLLDAQVVDAPVNDGPHRLWQLVHRSRSRKSQG